MTVELAAVRLLAPWFGTSSAVWTNVIGVVLCALALGYLLGSRLVQGAVERRMAWALILAAVFTLWLPALAAPVAGIFMPRGLGLDQGAGLLVLGSLAASALLFAPAALALGCVSPLAVEIVQRASASSAGQAGGRVLAASTLGSLAGTFATTHAALPYLGLDLTFLIAGGCLGLCGLALSGLRKAAGATLMLVLFAPAALLSRAAPPAVAEGERLLAARQSPYQALRVVERGAGAELTRRLEVNEGFDSFQSVWQPAAGLLPLGYYYNLFCLPPWWAKLGPGEGWRVCVLGLGAGTTWRVLEGAAPEGLVLEATGVEIDPVVVELGRRYFELPAERPGRRALAGWDARVALASLGGGFDQLVLDAYANQMEIPAHLSSVEFFRAARSALSPGGWLAINVGGFGLDDPVVRALGPTLAVAFEERVLALRVPFARNCVLFARRAAEPPEPGSAEFRVGSPDVRRLLAPLELPGAWRWFEPVQRAPLTDQRNPIEALQRRSIRSAAGWRLGS